MVVDTSERVYWPYLLSSLALAIVVLGPRHGLAELRRGLITSRLWTHTSARTDFGLLFAKAILTGLFRIPWIAATITATLWITFALERWLGAMPEPTWSPWAITWLYTLVLFVAWDLSRFVVHWLSHAISWLWAFHQVHHSAEVLNPLTLYRTHPVESMLYDLRGLATTAMISGFFLYLFRGHAIELQMLGINALGFTFNFLGGNLRHSEVWLRFGRWERWFLSPAQHQMHHGRTLSHQQSNYGTWLAIWDRCLGTWQPSPPQPIESFGLDDANHRPDSVMSALLGPFVEVTRLFVTRRRRAWGTTALIVGIGVGSASSPAHGAPPAEAAPTAPTPPSTTTSPPVDRDPPSTATPPPSESAPPDTPPNDPPPGPPSTATQSPSSNPPPNDPVEPPPTAPTATVPPSTVPPSTAPPSTAPPSTVPPAGVEGAPSEATTPPPTVRPAPVSPPPPDDAVDFELESDDVAAPSTATESAITRPKPEAAEPKRVDYDLALDSISVIGLGEQPRIAGSAHAIEEKELERKEYDDIHRVLGSVPGVYIREEDGYGLRPNIGLRGASSDRSSKVTLMEDGILLAPAPYSAPAAYYFPLVTRLVGVRVFKGPASIRFGPNTIGGAIDLRTRTIPTKMTAGIDAALGMRGYGKGHGYWGTSGKRWGVLLEGAHIQSNGFKELDGGGDTGFSKSELMVKARYNTDPGRRVYQQVEVKGGYARERSLETYLGIADTDFDDTPYRRYVGSQKDNMTWWRSQAQLSYLVARGSFVDFEATAYRNDFHRVWTKFNRFRSPIDIRDILANPDSGQTAVLYSVLTGTEDSLDPDQTLLIGTNDRTYFSQGIATVLHIRPTWRWLDQEIEFGARLHNDQIRRKHTEDGYLMLSRTLVPEGTETDVTTRNIGSAVAGAFHLVDTLKIKQLSSRPNGAEITLTPGARVEVIKTSFDDQLVDAQSSDVNTVFIPGIGFHVQALPWLGVLAGVHSGFSPVSPGQADDVKSEKSINYEAGGRLFYRTNTTATRVEAIGFFNDYSNLTSECTFSTGCSDSMINQQFNAGSVFVYGVEATASERIELPKRHFIDLGASYTYTGSQFRSTFTSENPLYLDVEEGDELPYVPEHLLWVHLGVGGKIWEAELVGSYMGAMRDVAGQGPISTLERVAPHFVADFNVHVAVTRRASLYLTIDNLANTAYMVSRRPFGPRPGMPFQLMGGFKYVIA